MDRRSFFKLGITKSKDVAIEVAKTHLESKFKREIIRPPGAIEEESFLLTCTRCEDCKTACPHDAIHLIDSVAAGLANKTPFVDPYYKACQYCEDMPCIEACEPKALRWKEDEKPKLALAVVVDEHCLVTQGQYCDYCFNSCPSGIKAIKKNSSGVPQIVEDECVGCGKCAYICVSQSGRAIEMESI